MFITHKTTQSAVKFGRSLYCVMEGMAEIAERSLTPAGIWAPTADRSLAISGVKVASSTICCPCTQDSRSETVPRCRSRPEPLHCN